PQRYSGRVTPPRRTSDEPSPRDRSALLSRCMPRASEALGLVRFTRGLPEYVRRTISLDQAKAAIRVGMARRATALLELVTRRVFGCPGSPYLKLFAAVGCELGDVRALVEREGVDDALRALHVSGIYVSFEEFKGLTPAIRGSQRFTFRTTDF